MSGLLGRGFVLATVLQIDSKALANKSQVADSGKSRPMTVIVPSVK